MLAQLKSAQDVPLWLADGQTFTCDGSAIAMLPNVCSAGFFIGTLTAEGEVEDPAPVDATALFEMWSPRRFARWGGGRTPPHRRVDAWQLR